MKHTKKPAQSMCGFLRFHTFLPYSTNCSLDYISSYHVTFYTSSSVKNIDTEISKKPLFILKTTKNYTLVTYY